MSDLNRILVFISYALRLFFINFLATLVYFFLVTAITITAFFLFFHTLRKPIFFWLYLVVLIVVNYKSRNFIFFKLQLRMNVMFLYFLDIEVGMNTGKNFLQVKLPGAGDLADIVKKVKGELKKAGVNIILHKLLLAASAVHLKNDKGNVSRKMDVNVRLSFVYKYILLQFFVFFILMIPFGAISFFFTMGMGVTVADPVKYLIYLLGFFFVYFLNAAIVEPIVCLLVQRKAYRGSLRP
jgi:hypothetical protein